MSRVLENACAGLLVALSAAACATPYPPIDPSDCQTLFYSGEGEPTALELEGSRATIYDWFRGKRSRPAPSQRQVAEAYRAILAELARRARAHDPDASAPDLRPFTSYWAASSLHGRRVIYAFFTSDPDFTLRYWASGEDGEDLVIVTHAVPPSPQAFCAWYDVQENRVAKLRLSPED